MGLDMWILSGSKPDENKIPEMPNLDALRALGYRVFEEDEEYMDLLLDILPICIKRKGKTTVTDWDRFRKDFDIPEDAEPTMASYGGDCVYFKYATKDGLNLEVDLSAEEFRSYDIEKDAILYITKLEEISCYRKEYDLENDIYDVYHEFSSRDIENCGYHHLTGEMIKELNQRNSLFAEECFSEDDESLYYHEWY